jgi:phage baseplate assembly protein W
MTAINIKQHIEQMILNYEPRVELSEVKIKADSDNNAYDCFISYFIKNIELPFTFNFLLKQIR